MGRKINIQLEQESSKKDVLEKILEDMNKDDYDIGNTKSNEKFENIQSEFHLNYDEVTATSETKAKEIVLSIANFYLDNDVLKNDPYVNQKMQLDVLSISNLLFQMVTSEHAIKILLREIDNGNFHPRMFEVLGGLQKSKMEIVKHLKQVEIIMENNYKGLMIEYDNKNTNYNLNHENQEEEHSNNSQIGTKALLKQMQSRIKTIEAAAEIETYTNTDDEDDVL
jgi:hypothetical protein